MQTSYHCYAVVWGFSDTHMFRHSKVVYTSDDANCMSRNLDNVQIKGFYNERVAESWCAASLRVILPHHDVIMAPTTPPELVSRECRCVFPVHKRWGRISTDSCPLHGAAPVFNRLLPPHVPREDTVHSPHSSATVDYEGVNMDRD